MDRFISYFESWRYTQAVPKERGLFSNMSDQATERREWLAKTPLFHSIQEGLLTELAGKATTVSLDAYQILFQKGDPGERVYVVISGLIRIGTISPEGREVTYGLLGPGELLGEIAVLDGGERSADAVAIQPSQLLSIERRELLAFLGRHPSQAVKMMQVLCARIRRADELLEDVVFLSLPARLAKHLLTLSGTMKDGDIRLSQQEIAEHLGVSRESVNKVLSKWDEGGLVTLGRGRIGLKNRKAVEEVANPN